MLKHPNLILGLMLFAFSGMSEAVPTTIYRGVDSHPHAQHYSSSASTYSPERAVQWYKGDERSLHKPIKRDHRKRDYGYPSHGTHVDVYVSPQPSQHYRHTQEVYLPYGGTYRSVTEHIESDSQPSYGIRFRGNYHAD